MTDTLLVSNMFTSLVMDLEEYAFSLNTVWVLLATALVFFMQAGFALVEAGFTRSKNTTNILFKNLNFLAEIIMPQVFIGRLLAWPKVLNH